MMFVSFSLVFQHISIHLDSGAAETIPSVPILTTLLLVVQYPLLANLF